MRIAIFLIGLSLSPTAAFANGATYGGSGGNVYPVYNADVSMPEEHVRLTIEGDDASWYTSTVSFECTFHLVNHGKAMLVPMGFPLVQDGFEDAAPDSAALNFHADVDGEPLLLRRANDGAVILFGVRFRPGQERVLHVTYELPWSWSDLSLYPADITYILRTGRLWRDPIGHGVVEIVSGFKAPVLAFSFTPAPTSFEGGVARWEFRNLRPEEDIRIRFSPEVAEGYEGRFVGPYEFRRLPAHRSARELLDLLGGEWEEAVHEDWGTDYVESGRTAAADSARVQRQFLEGEGRTRILTPIESLNLAYAREVERVCTETRDRIALASALNAVHRRFW